MDEENPEERNEKQQKMPKEVKEAMQAMLVSICGLKADDLHKDGSLRLGTIVRAKMEDDDESVGLGLILKDWYKDQDEDGSVTRNGRRYEVALFNQHKLVFSTTVKTSNLEPVFEPEDVAAMLMDHHPSVSAGVAAILSGIRGEENCRGCAMRRKMEGKDDEE